MLRDDYINAIKKAGFRDVSVVGESVYPITLLINDPEVEAAINKHKITKEQVNDYAKKVLSIKLTRY